MLKSKTVIIAFTFLCSTIVALYPLSMHASEEQEMKKSLDLLRAAAKGHIEKKAALVVIIKLSPCLHFHKQKKGTSTSPRKK